MNFSPLTASNLTAIFTHPPKILRFSQLNDNFNGPYLSSECNMICTIGQVRWQVKGVSYIVSKRHGLWSTNGLKLDRRFHAPFENSAFFFIAGLRSSQFAHTLQTTELNQSLPCGREQTTVTNCCKMFRSTTPQKIGAQTMRTYLRQLRIVRNSVATLRDLGRGTYVDNRENGVGNNEGFPSSSANLMNFGPLTDRSGTEVFTDCPLHKTYIVLRAQTY